MVKILVYNWNSDEEKEDLYSQSNKTLENKSLSNADILESQKNKILDRKNYLR